MNEGALAPAAVRASQLQQAANAARKRHKKPGQSRRHRRHKGKDHHHRHHRRKGSRKDHHHRHRRHKGSQDGPPSQSMLRNLSRVPEAPANGPAAADESEDETTTRRPSLSRHRSATIRVTGDDARELSSRLQRRVDEGEESETTTARWPSLERHRSATIHVTGNDAGELSSRLQERRRSVVGAGL